MKQTISPEHQAKMQTGARKKREKRAEDLRVATEVALTVTEKSIQMCMGRFGKLFVLVDAVEEKKASDRTCRGIQPEIEYDKYRGKVVIRNMLGEMPVHVPKNVWLPDEAEAWANEHTAKLTSLKGQELYQYIINNPDIRIQKQYIDTVWGADFETRVASDTRKIERMLDRMEKVIEEKDW